MTLRISLIAGILFLASLTSSATGGNFPSLAQETPPTWYPGKVVWHDLFTSEPDSAVAFYSAVFGWEAEPLELPSREAFIMRSDNYPVAVILERPSVEGDEYNGVWVGYASVGSVDGAIESVKEAQGRILVKRSTYPSRGDHAICTDPQGAIFGVIRLDSGDPGEYFSNTGEFVWSQHFSSDPEQAGSFYTSLGKYESVQDDRVSQAMTFLLTSGGYARASVGPLPADSKGRSADWIHFIRVGSITEALEKVADAGGKVVLATDPELAEGKVAIISDPNGALLGLMEIEPPIEKVVTEEVTQ